MERVEDEVISLIGASMTGDYLRPAADHYLVYIATDQHVPMAVGHRHRVVVGPVPDQRQRTDPGRVLVAGIVGGCRKGKQGRQVPLQSLPIVSS